MPDPIAVGIHAAGSTSPSPLIKLGIVLVLTSVILVSLLGQPRIFRAMAHDGMLPDRAAKILPSFQTPHLATIISGIAAAVLAGLFPIGLVGTAGLHKPPPNPVARSSRHRLAASRR